MSTIGMMDGAWINSTLDLNLAKIEDTANGCVACQLLDIMYPGKVPMNKVNWSAKQSFEFVANYKVLQTCFTKLSIERHVDVDRLITGKYMDNLEFMQWFKVRVTGSLSASLPLYLSTSLPLCLSASLPL
jgi:RP/EB family microtubule-associated protein